MTNKAKDEHGQLTKMCVSLRQYNAVAVRYLDIFNTKKINQVFP